MTAAAVTLASIAAVLEIGGIWLTVRDISAAREKIASYLTGPSTVFGSAGGLLGAATMTVEATVHGQTLEQRVEALEATQRGLREQLDRRDRKVTERLTRDFQGALKASEQTVDDRLTKLRAVVVGDGNTHPLRAYAGPIAVGLGILLGLAGNIVSTLA